MKINDKYEITVDSYGNYILTKQYISKVGTPAKKDLGYFPTLESVISYGLVEQVVRESELKDIKLVDKKIKQLKSDFIEALNKLPNKDAIQFIEQEDLVTSIEEHLKEQGKECEKSILKDIVNYLESSYFIYKKLFHE